MLTLYRDAMSVSTVTDSDITALANGSQGVASMFYVNIYSTAPFDRIGATRSQYALEFDHVACESTPVGAPDPGAAGVFPAGVAPRRIAVLAQDARTGLESCTRLTRNVAADLGSSNQRHAVRPGGDWADACQHPSSPFKPSSSGVC